jgi:pimeloyl-ACP methyl ester carboxylesterase
MTDFVTVRGARIRYRESGDHSRPAVVLLHGIGRSLNDWDPQHPLLSGEYHVISLDLPGAGLSDRLPEKTTLATLASGVRETLDALGVTGPLHLMGNSLGGAVAMRILADAPERVATLTLVNSAGFGPQVAAILRVLAIPGVGRLLLSRMDPRAVKRVERSLFVDRALITEERVAHGLEVAARADSAAVFLETAKALGTFRGIRSGWRTALLAAIAEHPRPTLIVWGDRDQILPAAQLAAARQALPLAQWHLFPQTGHMPQIERADQFAALARQFLAASTDTDTDTGSKKPTAGTPPRSG